ncbi:MAG TPA: Flp pilus assembly protein CpaB [Bacillales bacterium]|nr:Flp pilus assembly protein CpaB [Bacillales bacterium]
MRSKFVLMLSLLMGIVTTLLFYQYMKQLNVEKTTTTKMVDVVVAKAKIEKNETITMKKLEMVKVPKKSILPQSLKSFSDAEGKIAISVIEKGEPILSHRLVSEKEEGVYVSRKVREGFRAVSVGVDINQSVTNLIEPEDEVDVILTVVKKDKENNPLPNSVVLLQKVKVLAVGRKMVTPENTKDPYVEFSSVTLELTPEDAISLINEKEKGKIHLILNKRPTMDETNNPN